MALATLSIDLVAKLASLEQGLDKAYRMNERTAQQIEGRWKAMSVAAASLGAAIGGAFSAQAIIRFTTATVDALDALNDSADATGATIENLSALEDVARKNGGTLEDVTGILVKFNNVLKEADGKNGVSQALKAIGLDADQLRKIDPAEALRITAVALAGFADDGNKARIVQELFGKSIREAAPFLKDLAEAGRLNATVTTEQAKQAEEFNKRLAELQTTVSNSARGIIAGYLPALEKLASEFATAAKSGDLLWTTLEKIGRATNPANILKNALTPTSSTDVQRLQQQIAGLENVAQREPDNAANNRRLASLRSQLEIAQEIARFQGRASGAANTVIGSGADSGAPSLPSLPGKLPTGAATKKEYTSAITDAKDYYKSLFLLSEKAAYDIKELSDSVPFGPNLDQAEIDRRNQGFADLQAILASLPSAQIDRVKAAQAQLNVALQDGSISAEQFKDASKVLDDELKALQQTGVDVGKSLEMALGESLSMALKGNFDSIGEYWTNMLLDMVAKAAAADLQNALFKTGSGGNLAQLGSAFLSFFGVPGFASGGDHKGGVRLVGERGPELEFTGPSRILNASQTRRAMSGGGGGQIVINVAAGVGRAEVYQATQQALQAAKADTRQLLRMTGSY